MVPLEAIVELQRPGSRRVPEHKKHLPQDADFEAFRAS